jgi:hypothetical protein
MPSRVPPKAGVAPAPSKTADSLLCRQARVPVQKPHGKSSPNGKDSGIGKPALASVTRTSVSSVTTRIRAGRLFPIHPRDQSYAWCHIRRISGRHTPPKLSALRHPPARDDRGYKRPSTPRADIMGGRRPRCGTRSDPVNRSFRGVRAFPCPSRFCRAAGTRVTERDPRTDIV